MAFEFDLSKIIKDRVKEVVQIEINPKEFVKFRESDYHNIGKKLSNVSKIEMYHIYFSSKDLSVITSIEKESSTNLESLTSSNMLTKTEKVNVMKSFVSEVIAGMIDGEYFITKESPTEIMYYFTSTSSVDFCLRLIK